MSTKTFDSFTKMLGGHASRRLVIPGLGMLAAGTLGLLGLNTAEAKKSCAERCKDRCQRNQRHRHKGNRSRRCRNKCQDRCR